MVKMLVTNCYLRLWIFLCFVFRVSAENLLETNIGDPSHFDSSQLTAAALEPMIQQGNSLPQVTLFGEDDVSQTIGTKPYDVPYLSEILNAKTPMIEEQGLSLDPIFTFPSSGVSTEIKSVTPTLNQNSQVIPPKPTFAQILFALTKRSTFEAFSFLLRSFNSYNIPTVLLNVQSTVMRLIRLNFLRVREILDYLQRYSHLPETDLAVMGLLFLAESLPRDCELRADIHELTSAVVLLKLMEQSPLSIQQEQKCINKIVKIENPVKCTCKPDASTTNYYRPMTDSTAINKKILYSVQKTEQSSVTVVKEAIMKAITIPLVTEMEHAYNVTKSFIESSENVEIMKSLTLKGATSQELLLRFYTVVKQQTTISIETKEEILKYIDYVLGRYIPITPTPEIRFDYAVLLEILPNPADRVEEKYLALLRTALKSEEAYALLRLSGLESVTDQKKQLIEVLKVVQTKYSSMEIKEAAKYYLEYLEKLESLTLIGTKKIEKRFDLTGIFTDTLQLGSLPSSAKLAFKKIYKYIANIHGNEMENFNEWNEATTRAQFIQYLFNYFLAQEFVPTDVKTAITTLIPHIQKDGKGALPP